MRTFLLMLGTVVVIAALAGVYVWMQPATQQPSTITQRITSTTRPAIPTTGGSDSLIRSGEGAFFTVPDVKTGRTAWQFRASRWDPQTDNSVLVNDPQAEFFLDNGQVLSISGTHGRLVLPANAGKTSDFKGQAAPPSRGDLYDVIIKLFSNEAREHTVLTCNVNNVSFDNDTFRIATEAYKDANGVTVPADQVPVQVRGDYDFDGRGLTILWNDRERHLQLLEIAHGESLTVPANMAGDISATTKPAVAEATPVVQTPRAEPATPRANANPRRSNTAAGTETAQRPTRGGRGEAARTQTVATTSPTTKKSTTQPVYQAIFEGGQDGVEVVHGDETIATGGQLIVMMRPDEQSNDSMGLGGKAPPTPAPAAPAAPQRRAGTQTPARAGATTRRAARNNRPAPAQPPVQAAPVAAAAPSTQPTGEPVVVYWSGPLRIIPLEESKAPKLAAGERTVEMISDGKTPVVLHLRPENANATAKEIECASFLYNSSDDSLVVRSTPQFPMISMKDEEGSSFFTPSLIYGGKDRKAVLEGASRAEVMHEGGLMHASWTDRCVLTLVAPADEHARPNGIEKAEMTGNVKVDDPKLKLDSKTLVVEFAPPAEPSPDAADKKKASASVKAIVATGDVKCVMLDEQNKSRHIDTDQLVLATEKTATGEIVPREISAIGKAHSYDDDENDLQAGQLKITLQPATRPSDPAKVERLLAQDQVVFKFKDGGGTAALLDAVAEKDFYNITLSGSPATLNRQNSTLSGPVIRMNTGTSDVDVPGAGTMRGEFTRNQQDAKPTPFDVKWDGDMTMRGQSNFIKLNRGIVVSTTTPSDGTVTTITGDTALMDLADDPAATTKPTTSTTQSSAFGDAFSSLRNKTVRKVTIDGGTKTDSVTLDSSGNLLRRMHLDAPLIVMEGETEDKKIIVPAPGRMLFEQHPPATQPSTQPTSQPIASGTTTAPSTTQAAATTRPTTAPTGPFGNMTGATAFQWQKQLTFDQATGQADMTGDVLIVHGEDDKAQDYFRLLSDNVQAEFEQLKSTEPKKPGESDFKLKKLTASGNVKFASKQIEFLAPLMRYDPDTTTLRAIGDDVQAVRVFEIGGAPRGSFGAVSWNTETWQINIERALGQFGR